MASRRYSNFDLSIERDGDHYRARVLQSCAGEGSVEFKLPFSATELENFILKIGHARRGNWRGGHGADSVETAAAKDFGGKLFGAVFQGDVYARLLASLEESRTKKQGVRVLLRLTPELADLPWEYLYNPAWNQFFSLSVDTPLVRYFDLTPTVSPLDVTLPLRLLVVISSPSDYPPLDVEREWRDLQAALQPLAARGLVEIERLERASLLALQRQLWRSEYHIFHFIGHGSFDERKQDGVLIFSDEHGRGRPLSGQDLGTLLRNHPSLRLALLNACEGARAASDDPFAGVAHSLVQMGLPAVIAMQFEISDAVAILFAQVFYAALADGYGVDAALTHARAAISASGGSVEWGTPVLFSRTPDGRIFDLASTPVAVPSPVAKQAPISERVKPAPAPDVARLYEDGLSAFHLGDWTRAQECFQAVLKLRRDYHDAAEKLNQAQHQLDLAQRYQQAQDLLDRSDWPSALEVLEKLTAEAPGYRDATQRLQHARQQSHLQALYADATRQSQAGEWQAVIDSFAQIAKLQPDYPDPKNLLVHARKQLTVLEREKKLADLYGNALQALNNRRWSDAQRFLTQIQKTRPGYRDAPLLLEKASAEMARQRSTQGGEKLLVWLAAHRRGTAVVGLVLIGLFGLIFILANWPLHASPAIIASAMPTATSVLAPSTTTPLSYGQIPTSPPTPTSVLAPTIARKPSSTPLPTIALAGADKMVLIPAGPFQMGSNQSDDEKPIHTVTLNAFLMDKYEVTNAEYAKCVAAGNCKIPADKTSYTRKDYYDNKDYANYPVVNVSWTEADIYCKSRGARLPSEAEWEKAARGGLDSQLYPWGDTAPVCTTGAENGAQSYVCSVKDTVAVGSFNPNGYGLFDMAGNAWEWVNDWYDSSYYGSSPASNPTGPTTGQSNKVLRGGGWYTGFGDLRVANRGDGGPPYRYGDGFSFRCAATPEN